MVYVVLITGVNKDHLVIGSIRNTPTALAEVEAVKAFPTAEGTKLMLVHIESTSPTDAADAIQTIKDAGVKHLDLVEMIATYQYNTIGPLMLFQACRPLLQEATSPKWISISTGGASITRIGSIRSWDGPAYAAAKAALNWMTRYGNSLLMWLTLADTS
ncbi:hypothetical protein F5Y17DRAFT_460287 [Xylariaceae sp. FL0594]|nr:hypothetical protein F5Y17DRAFT_460287 [Xylariaceae sp. FL0594]